jgi:hypothetical protein
MTTLILSFILITSPSHADIKSYEKAKMDLISSIENLVNIQECRKDIASSKTSANSLPYSCSKIEYLSKYSFTKKDSKVINDYLSQEEGKIVNDSKELLAKYKIKSLGKVMLSKRCVLGNQIIDLDKYLDRIRSGAIGEMRIPAAGEDTEMPEATPKQTSIDLTE